MNSNGTRVLLQAPDSASIHQRPHLGRIGASVLIVDGNQVRRTELATALGSPLQVGTISGASAILAATHPRVVISHGNNARLLLRELAELSPASSCLFLSDGHGDELVEVAAEGHSFIALNTHEPKEIHRHIEQLLRPRAIFRSGCLGGLEVSWTANGIPGSGVLLDAGNHGLAINVAPDTGKHLAAGTEVSEVCVRKNGEVLLSVRSAEIRYQRRHADGRNVSFVVGLRFNAPQQTAAAAHPTVIRDRFRVLGLVRRALRNAAPFQLGAADLGSGASAPTVLELAHSNGTTPRLWARQSGARTWNVGDVLQLDFELLGQGHRGLASVIEVRNGGFIISVPNSLHRQHRRQSLRFQPTALSPFSVSFRSPLDGKRFERRILDLHPSGASFEFEPATDVLPRGLRLDQVRLIAPDGTHYPCAAETCDVSSSDDSEAKERSYRCGIKLSEVPPAARRAIFNAYVAGGFAGIEDGGDIPFSDIWQAVSQTKAWYGDFPLGPGAHVETLTQTHRAVTREETLARTFVFRDQGSVVGHASGLRYYAKTWVMHHLAVAPGFHREEHIAGDLTQLVMNYAETLEDVEFIRFIWHTQNRFPNRIGRLSARSLPSEGLTRLRFFNHLRAPKGAPLRSPLVRAATASDHEWLEAHVRESGDAVGQRADDLTCAEIGLSTVGERFATAGLVRSRNMFVVDGEDGPLAVGLAERASPGLHWGEFLNAFTLIVPHRDAKGADEARTALVGQCQEFYAEAGRNSTVALVADEDVSLLTNLGFTSHGRFAEFTFHRKLVRSWTALYRGLFERLSRRPATMGER